MKHRILQKSDVWNYGDDLLSMYQTNRLVIDSQSPLDLSNRDSVCEFIEPFVTSNDSMVVGIFDEQEKYLYGIVIFDNIRFDEVNSCAQIHIVNDKSIFGKKVRNIYGEIIESMPFTTLYCEIPSIAVHAIAVCKRAGFKKTGYIPLALPYKNIKGEEKLYDLQIFTYRRSY